MTRSWQPLPGGRPDPRPVGDSLGRATAPMGFDAALLLAWPALVGETIAAHTRPRRLREGVLTVVVDDPAWATQIRFMEAELVTGLEGVIGPGKVTQIVVQVQGNVTPSW